MLGENLSDGERAVLIFLESVAFALGWGAVDRLLGGSPLFVVLPISIASIVVSYAGFKWPRIKQSISSRVALTFERVASDFRWRVGLFLMIAFILSSYLLIYLHTLRSDFNMYATPRRVTEKQAEKLREYLSRYDPSAVTITVVPNDQEAMEFAAELFTALRKTKWDINPPDHGGVGYIQIPSNEIKPNRGDVDAKGLPRYKNYAEYLDAHDAWLQKDIARRVHEQTAYSIGVSIFAKSTEQAAILHGAFDYAEIQVDSVGSASLGKGVSLIVGHRPTVIGDTTPLLYRIGERIQGWAQ